LLGRALARQMLANHAGAEADLSVVLAGAPDAALPLAMRGFIRVMLAKWPEAAQDLARAAGLPNAPPEVALWRFIAESRAGLAAAPALAAAAKALPPSAWPSPVMQYFLGALSGDQVLDAAEREPALAQMRLCEAYYYLGEAASLLGDSESAQKMLTAAVGTCLRRHTEYAGAKAALARLASGSQSPPPVR
jgi:lipoprotein NlpI